MLIVALFSIPTLTWSPSSELQHLELFAGDCAVTRGEVMDRASGQSTGLR